MKIRGVTFDWNEEASSAGFNPPRKYDDVGVIAQEIEEVLPQLISLAPFDTYTPGPSDDQDDPEIKARIGKSKSGKNYKTVDYTKITPLLIEAIKEQQKQIQQQQQQINALKDMIHGD